MRNGQRWKGVQLEKQDARAGVMRWLGFILLLGVLLSVAAAKLRRMRGLQDHSLPIHPLMRVPVPWVFVLAYLAGVGL